LYNIVLDIKTISFHCLLPMWTFYLNRKSGFICSPKAAKDWTQGGFELSKSQQIFSLKMSWWENLQRHF